jgi:hypothetical protein
VVCRAVPPVHNDRLREDIPARLVAQCNMPPQARIRRRGHMHSVDIISVFGFLDLLQSVGEYVGLVSSNS